MKHSKELKKAMIDTEKQVRERLITEAEGYEQIRLAIQKDQKKDGCNQ